MAFTITIGLATEHDLKLFLERVAPKLHAQSRTLAEGEDGLHRIALSVTTPNAAREICSQLVAFLAHAKNTRVDLFWTGANGEEQSGQIEAGDQRSAEIVALRLVHAARAALEGAKA